MRRPIIPGDLPAGKSTIEYLEILHTIEYRKFLVRDESAAVIACLNETIRSNARVRCAPRSIGILILNSRGRRIF